MHSRGSPLDLIVLQALAATGLLLVSLWWYRRHRGEKSGNAGLALWVVWVVFGILSLVILAASGLATVVLGGAVTWPFCVAGTVLGSRLLVRSSRKS